MEQMTSHQSASTTKWGGMRRSLTAVVATGLLASSLSFALPAAAQAESELAAFAPENTIFYSEFELDQESDQLVKSSELLERANLTSLLSEDDAAELDETVDAASMLTSGQAAVVVTDAALANIEDLTGMAADVAEVGTEPVDAVADEIPEGWALVVMPTEVEDAFDLYYSIAFDDAEVEPTEVEYNGYTIFVSEPVDEYSEPMAIAQVDDVIVFSTSQSGIEDVIDTATGDTGALAESDNFTSVRDSFEDDVLAFGYIDGPAIIEAVQEIPEIEAALDASGGLEASYNSYSGFAVWADDAGFRMDSIALPAENVTFETGTPYVAAYAADTPADVLFFTGGTDLGQNTYVQSLALYMGLAIIGVDAETSDALATPTEDPEAVADAVFAEVEETTGFNIKTDLLDQMVGEWAVSGTVTNFTGEFADINASFATQLEDGATVQAITDQLTEMISESGDSTVVVSSRDINGSAVTSLEVTDDDVTVTIEYGVVDNQLVIGINDGLNFPELAQDGSLADDEVYAQTFDVLPSDNLSSSSYLSMAQALPLIDSVIATTSTSELDADPACGEFASQEEAQAALDGDPYENWELDMDFDLEACEDFFNPATPEAEPAAVTEDINVLSIGSVTFGDEASIGSSAIILIGE